MSIVLLNWESAINLDFQHARTARPSIVTIARHHGLISMMTTTNPSITYNMTESFVILRTGELAVHALLEGTASPKIDVFWKKMDTHAKSGCKQ
jgi:hypothetical protein